MKNAIIALILFSILIFATNKSNAAKPTTGRAFQCASWEVVENYLDSKEQKPQFNSQNEQTEKQTNIMLFQNNESGDWTLIEIYPDKACIMGFGKNKTV